MYENPGHCHSADAIVLMKPITENKIICYFKVLKENPDVKDYFNGVPRQFEIEATDETRLWFYYLYGINEEIKKGWKEFNEKNKK